MKYSVASIDCEGLDAWQVDVLMQELADVGFDSFEQDGGILRAYIPTEHATAALTDCTLSFIHCHLSIESCPDENWNAVWEASHEVEELPLGVKITPRCAFGAGHHETTSMMIDELLHHAAELGLWEEDRQAAKVEDGQEEKAEDCRAVLDMGTGTGVLAIVAAKMGARHVVAVDIDENSVLNAQENATANGVQIDVLQGATVPQGRYGLIMANIHRNILIAQMPDYARNLCAGGEVWLSGFYEADVPVLVAAAAKHGLRHTGTRRNGEWRMITLN